jgi:hypothetical protein
MDGGRVLSLEIWVVLLRLRLRLRLVLILGHRSLRVLLIFFTTYHTPHLLSRRIHWICRTLHYFRHIWHFWWIKKASLSSRLSSCIQKCLIIIGTPELSLLIIRRKNRRVWFHDRYNVLHHFFDGWSFANIPMW